MAESPELQADRCVAAHLAHVSYGSRRDAQGNILPRYRIILASSIDEATCLRVNLAYQDYRQFRLEEYRHDPDTLIVERAGRDLYLTAPA
jgi:hypothetical protein